MSNSMYSSIKQIQIIVSLLKQFGVRHIVISPGTRHVPLAHSCEIDPFFTCYSVVDERSAGFFALGLSERLDQPVAMTCTSATATCNYMPAMQEASSRGIQLVALTADRARYQRFHGENQCIDQVDMFTPCVRYSVDLPDVQTDEDYWYCNRRVNEALLELNHRGKGPVQINFLEPLSIARLSTFDAEQIAPARRIYRHGEKDIDWDRFREMLRSRRRILVLAGQHAKSAGLNKALNDLARNSNVVVTHDHFSNLEGERFVHSALVGEVLNADELERLKPDLIITYGSKIFSVLGTRYRNRGIEHWHVDPEGGVYDIIHTLTNVFECSPQTFFEKAGYTLDGDNEYLRLWQERVRQLDFTLDDYTNHLAIRTVLEHLPANSTVHASVLNSMRIANFYKLPPGSELMGNICADGIDGALSAFLGQAEKHDGTALLIVGDLSFLYDLNGAFYPIPANVRILLINNYAGAEFHYNIGQRRIATLNRHIAAGHHTDIRDVTGLTNLEYRRAVDRGELEEQTKALFGASSGPVLLEVVTDADRDGESLRRFFARNRKLTRRNKIAKAIKAVFGDSAVSIIKKLQRG